MRSARYATDWGTGWVCWDRTGITSSWLPGSPAPIAEGGQTPPQVSALCRALEAYFAGRGGLPDGRAFAEAAGSTPFTRRVYDVVCSIPSGSTMTYAAVAAAAGRPGAARAVGAAMAANPFAPMVPCHRVVGSDGSLRGYGGGLELKQWMLAMEGAR